MLNYLALFISVLIDLYSFAVVARILMSWFPDGGAARLKSYLYDLTEPFLAPFRNIIPRLGMIDISPIVALLALDLFKSVLIYLLTYLMR